jgi:ent-kaurene synthase
MISMVRDAYGTASSRRAFMAYVSEGLGNLQDWNQVMAYQRKNGSILNSPSATAATIIHGHNYSGLAYLDFVTSKFGGPGVPPPSLGPICILPKQVTKNVTLEI